MNNEKTMSKVYGARWSPRALEEVYGANYGGFVRRTLKITKHPFIPREEPVSEKFVPRKKSEKKVEKGLDFIPKV
jgi:hypothetical protein